MNVYDSIVQGSKRWPKRAREEINSAVLEYLFDGSMPDLESMNQYAAGTFEMLLPLLEHQRKQRANASKPRGSRKQKLTNQNDEPAVSQTLASSQPDVSQDGEKTLAIKNIPYSYSYGYSLSGEEELLPGSSSESDLLVGRAFQPPTVEEVRSFCAANLLDKVNPELFVATYEAQGWKLGNGIPMTNWKAAAQKWHQQDRNKQAVARSQQKKADYSEFSADTWERG